MLEEDLKCAIEDLRLQLDKADEAAKAITRLLPRLTAINSLFRDLDSLVGGAREVLAAQSVSTAELAAEWPEPGRLGVTDTPPLSAHGRPGLSMVGVDSATEPAAREDRERFRLRLRIESNSGQVDLATIDKEVTTSFGTGHMELVEYDGRSATVDVWSDPGLDLDDLQRQWSMRVLDRLAPDTSLTILSTEQAA